MVTRLNLIVYVYVWIIATGALLVVEGQYISVI